jgi:hypothetical protein
MGNIFKDLLTRIKIDYHDYRQELTGKWNLRREARQIEKAKQRARFRNSKDGRTYYIIKDKSGAISALTSDQVKFWTAQGMFPKMNYMQLLKSAIAIVTSNESVLEQYNQEQLKNESYEQSDNGKSR